MRDVKLEECTPDVIRELLGNELVIPCYMGGDLHIKTSEIEITEIGERRTKDGIFVSALLKCPNCGWEYRKTFRELRIERGEQFVIRERDDMALWALADGEEEYLIKLHEIREEQAVLDERLNQCKEKEYRLAKEYALAHNPYEVGDVIEDSKGLARINSIEVNHVASKLPFCVYHCYNLTKAGKISKVQSVRTVWQINVIKKH